MAERSIRTFDDAIRTMSEGKPFTAAFAWPCDAESLQVAATLPAPAGSRRVLVGSRDVIGRVAREHDIALDGCEWAEAPDPDSAAALAARIASAAPAGILVKGVLNSSAFLRAMLDRANGLRGDGDAFLSHLSIFEVPRLGRLLFMSDGGLNVAPDLEAKAKILRNAAAFIRRIGYATVRVAAVTANENVDPAMPATLDAAALARMGAEGAFPGCEVEGPIALDVALDPEAAYAKNATGPAAGRADLLIVPSIEAGNILGKAVIHLAGGSMAGVVLGAKAPAVLTSRGAPVSFKIASIAFAAVAANAVPERSVP